MHRQLGGKIVCSGKKSQHSAYRAELAGIFGGLMMLRAICKKENLRVGKILLVCDCLGAIKKIQHKHTSLSALHFDYISSIQSIIEELPLQIEFLHVNGHADELAPLHELSILERMNVTADHMANEKNESLNNNHNLEELNLYNELGPVRVSIDQQFTKISSNLRSNLYKEITKSQTEDYWVKKLKIDQEGKTLVDWDQMDKSFSSISIERQKEVVKWNSEFCGTGKNLKRWKEQSHQRCPVCGIDGEDTEHIMKCPHPTARTAWNKTIQKL